MIRFFFLTISMIGGSLIVPVTAADEQAQFDPGRHFATHVEKLFANMTETEYQGRTEIDEETGSLKCDCSGLMSHVLRHHFPEAYVSTSGDEALWRKRPLSVTFFETFMAAGEDSSAAGPWKRVRKLMEARPGDIIAWRKVEIEEGVSSGHTMMVVSLPEKEPDDRIRVRVIDSTRKTHANDTRPPGKLGVGAGDMWFTVDGDGEPVGFYVDDESGESTSNKIAIGRLIAVDEEVDQSGSDSEFVGLKISSAMDLAEERNLECRIIDEEGKIEVVKIGHKKDRLNFVVRKGRVARVIRE